jgi:hypothetical protein
MEQHTQYKYLAWWSAGITSAVACKLAVNAGATKIIFIETHSHHADAARFKNDCEKWYGQEIEIWNNKKWEDHFDVIETRKFINGPKGSICTDQLKKSVREVAERYYLWKNQVFGFEYKLQEIQRAKRFKRNYPHANAIFPLIKKHITKNNAAAILLQAGIELPTMYYLGYNHNNCIGCVKGGKGYWNKIRIDFPNIFERMKNIEIEIGHSCINGKFLKDLQPDEGRGETIIAPECGAFCEQEDKTHVTLPNNPING